MDIVGRGTDALSIFPQAPLLQLVIWSSRFFLAAENVRPAGRARKLHELLPTRTIFLHGALISKKSHSPAPARNFPGASATFFPQRTLVLSSLREKLCRRGYGEYSHLRRRWRRKRSAIRFMTSQNVWTFTQPLPDAAPSSRPGHHMSRRYAAVVHRLS